MLSPRACLFAHPATAEEVTSSRGGVTAGHGHIEAFCASVAQILGQIWGTDLAPPPLCSAESLHLMSLRSLLVGHTSRSGPSPGRRSAWCRPVDRPPVHADFGQQGAASG